MSPGWIAALGFLSLAGYWAAVVGLRGSGSTEDVLAFLGLFAGLFAVYFTVLWVTRSGDGGGVVQILIWAFLFRLALLPAGLPRDSWIEDLGADVTGEAVAYRTFLLYDNDVWRYLWDGHVSSAGHDPYAAAPAELEALADGGNADAEALFEPPWDDVFDNVYFRAYKTVYPPLSQLLFRLLHAAFPASVFALKLALALFDFGTCLLLVSILRRLGGAPPAVVIYAWNPLVVKEIAGSGHVDALMIFFLMLTVDLMLRGRRRWGLVAYGLAILSKLTPVLLVGLFLRRTRPREWPLLLAVGAAGYLPYLASWGDIAQGVRAFSREWVFNPGPWALWKWLSELAGASGRGVAAAAAAVLTLALIAWVVVRDDGSDRRLVAGCLVILGGYVVLSATVMPWYLLWALPFVAALRIGYAWTALTCLSLLSYLTYIDQVERPWWLWTEFLVFFLLLVWEVRWKNAGGPGTQGGALRADPGL